MIVFLHWAGDRTWWPCRPLSTSLFYDSNSLKSPVVQKPTPVDSTLNLEIVINWSHYTVPVLIWSVCVHVCPCVCFVQLCIFTWWKTEQIQRTDLHSLSKSSRIKENYQLLLSFPACESDSYFFNTHFVWERLHKSSSKKRAGHLPCLKSHNGQLSMTSCAFHSVL